MVCESCGAGFCWICLKIVKGYDHYNDPNNPNKCSTFSAAGNIDLDLEGNREFKDDMEA